MLVKNLLRRTFTTIHGRIPIVDTTKFLSNNPNALSDCKEVAAALEETSCLLIKDPRIDQSNINEFIDLMEAFFESRGRRYYNGEKELEDFYPQYSYQTGATPDQTFVMRDLSHVVNRIPEQYKPKTKFPTEPDSKWRLLWRVGERSPDPRHISVDPPVHVPSDFPQWRSTMDKVGYLLLDGVNTVSEMLALGLGFERKLFSNMLAGGPQVLAPSASELTRYKNDTPLSGFHYDMNFLTIHGKNRFPGLYIWLKNGERVKVSVPEGHLLLQVGKQLEMLTGGYLHAGYHEVICTEEAKTLAEKAKSEGRSAWRINSTLFASTHPETILRPLDRFATEEAKKLYPPVRAQEQLEEEFEALNMTQQKYSREKSKLQL